MSAPRRGRSSIRLRRFAAVIWGFDVIAVRANTRIYHRPRGETNVLIVETGGG